MNYDVDYFIKKFKAIPATQWTTGDYVKGKRRCALGHCGETIERTLPEGTALRHLISLLGPISIGELNDGDHSSPRYFQKTPKKRVLAALKDVKALQEAK